MYNKSGTMVKNCTVTAKCAESVYRSLAGNERKKLAASEEPFSPRLSATYDALKLPAIAGVTYEMNVSAYAMATFLALFLDCRFAQQIGTTA